MISDDALCALVTDKPGNRLRWLLIFAKLDTSFETKHLFAEALQRLRVSGRIHYKQSAWYPGKGYTL